MLTKIREGGGRWVAGIVLVLISAAFIFWGVDPTIMGTTFAAKVNGEDISLGDFERALQVQRSQYQELYRLEITDDLQRELRLSVIENLVRNRALLQRVQSSGYRVSDERLIQAIQLRPEFQVNGEFSLDLLRARILSQGLPESFFLDRQREQLALLELENSIATSAFYTSSELARYVELYSEERELAYALFEADSFRDQVVLDEADTLAYYEANKVRFYTEESVDLEYIEVLRADLAEGIEVTDEILENYYEDERYRFQTEDERRARHILINSAEEDSEAEADATEILARLEAGEDFQALASELSEDAGTRAQGGDLGWLSRGILVGPFEDALFAMEVGDFQGPIKTAFGYHIILLEEIRAGDVQTFESVREELIGDYQSSRAETLFYEQATELADQAFDAFDELASVAAEIGLPLQSFEGLTRTGLGSPFAASAPVIQTAFSPEVLGQGENSGLVEIADDHVVVLRVVTHHLPAEQLLDAVRTDIEEELTQVAAETLAGAAAEGFSSQMERYLVERVAGSQVAGSEETEDTVEGTVIANAEEEVPVDSGSSLAALVIDHGGAWTAPQWVERIDPNVPTAILAAVFRAQQVQDETVREQIALASGDQAVVVISGIRPGDADSMTLEEQRQRINQLAEQLAMYELTSYAGQVRSQATVRIPEAVLDPLLIY